MFALDTMPDTRRAARQCLGHVVRHWPIVVHPSPELARDIWERRERWRQADAANKIIWAAEAQFWARIGQTATDGCGRLRWHKSELDRYANEYSLLTGRREAGFIRAATELQRLRTLLRRGRWSRSGLTWQGTADPSHLLGVCPSPHRLERWLAKVRRRAALILQPWDLAPSWRAIADVIGTGRNRLLPVGKAAIAVVALTLHQRFSGRVNGWIVPRGIVTHDGDSNAVLRRWWQVIAEYRIHRVGGIAGTPPDQGPRGGNPQFGRRRATARRPPRRGRAHRSRACA
jgi:hypothetical protein